MENCSSARIGWETVHQSTRSFAWPTSMETLFLGSTVRVFPERTVSVQRKAWLEQTRAHIAPWKLLEQRVRALPENIRQHMLKAL